MDIEVKRLEITEITEDTFIPNYMVTIIFVPGKGWMSAIYKDNEFVSALTKKVEKASHYMLPIE